MPVHPTASIHPSAIVEDGAEIAADVCVGPYAFVGPEVAIGAGTRIDHGVVLDGRTRVGEQNHLFPYCVVGTIPQDKKYDGEPARVEIGDHNQIREHVTIHIGTKCGIEVTRIGDHNLIMAGAGDDVVTGGGGPDVLHGEAGDDIITGGAQGDELWGGAGADQLDGAGGNEDGACSACDCEFAIFYHVVL